MLRTLTLLVTGMLIASLAQAATIEDYFRNLDSFEARFVQRLFDADQVLQDESQGVIKIQRPDRFYLHYSKPYELLYIADGTRLWSYDADLEQVIVKKQENLLRDTPAMILSNPQNLQRQYRIEQLDNDQGLTWFRLLPKSADNQFDSIQLGFDTDQIRIMELKDSFGRVTRLEFADIKRNPSFPAGTFHFTPPKGVDIVQQ